MREREKERVSRLSGKVCLSDQPILEESRVLVRDVEGFKGGGMLVEVAQNLRGQKTAGGFGDLREHMQRGVQVQFGPCTDGGAVETLGKGRK